MWGTAGRGEQVPLNFSIPGTEVISVSRVNLSGVKNSGKGTLQELFYCVGGFRGDVPIKEG